MGGGGQSQPTNQNVTQTNLPKYAKPYFTRLMNRSEDISAQKYIPYGNERLAGMDPYVTQGIEASEALYNSGTPFLDQAGGYAGQGANVYSGLSNYQNPNINVNYDQGYTGVNAQNIDASGNTVSTGTWDQAAADRYMNPYLDTVVSRQRENMYDDFRRQALERNSAAVKAGAYGGSRQAVGDYLAAEGFNQNLADMEAQQRYQAWAQAQGMFTSDEARRLQAAQSNQDVGFRTAAANQAAGLDAAKSNQQADLNSRQFGANLGYQTGLANQNAANAAANIRLGAGEGLNRSAELATNMEGQRQAIEAERIKNLMSAGAQRQAYEQSKLDLGYSDFINQRDWDRNQTQYLSSILRGVPVSANSNTTTYQPYNPLQAALGTGIGALSMAQLFQ